MKCPPRLAGHRGTATIALPQDLDAITISTSIGFIHIDLTAPLDGMVLLSAATGAGDESPTRLILSPMASGRLALGVIRSP